MTKQTLAVIKSEFTIHAFDPHSAIPASVLSSDYYLIGKTEDTLSVVVPSSVKLMSLELDEGWRALELLGKSWHRTGQCKSEYVYCIYFRHGFFSGES